MKFNNMFFCIHKLNIKVKKLLPNVVKKCIIKPIIIILKGLSYNEKNSRKIC